MIAKFTRKDFLEALFGDYYKEHRGFILVKSFKTGDPKMSTRYFPNIEILAKEHYGDERDVFFGVTPRERMKAEKAHIRYLVALWANLDIGQEGHGEQEHFFDSPQHAAKAIRSFPKTPSIIVESGRGAHLYWLLKEIIEIDDAEKIEGVLRDISKYLKSESEVSLDAALRLPETVNTKVPSQMVNCDVKFINSNFRYSLSDFENLGEPAPAGRKPTVSPGRSSTPSSSSRPQTVRADRDSTNLSTMMGPSTSTDSLVLDETIIDELIDDISMSTVVAENIQDHELEAPEPVSSDSDIITEEEVAFVDDKIDDGAETTVSNESDQYVTTSPGRGAPSRGGPQGAGGSRFLQELSSSSTDVEISLVGSDTRINGTLVWNENGLIGVKSSGHTYTIPLTSVSFIKSKS